MRTVIKLLSLFLLAIFVVECKDFEDGEKQVALKEYGKLEFVDENRSVELQINRFDDFEELFSRAERIVCNDSIPKITLKQEAEIKTIYLHNLCWEQFDCILIRENNVLKIHNDTVFKGSKPYHLDDLTAILKKDIENYGKDSDFSDSPQKLLIFVSYDIDGLEKLPNTLNLLADNFEELTNKRDIIIWLDKRIEDYPSK